MKTPKYLLIFLLLLLLPTACVPQASAPTASPTAPPPTSTAEPAAPPLTGGPSPSEDALLTWSREGGIAGFCDELAVYRSGEARATSCKGEEPAAYRLTAGQLEQLNAWAAELQSLELEQSDAAAADAMTVRLAFDGAGSRAASEDEQQALLAFAQEVYTQAAPGR